MTELGSLSQSARKTHLSSAQKIFWFIGGLTALLNGVMFANAGSEVDQVMQQMNLPAEARGGILATTQMIYGGTAALGVVFIVLGLLIYRKPVPIVITGLILYIGSIALFAVLNPATIVSGIIIKVIIIVGLVKSVQAAIAYERENAFG